jgi:hypothetical protein
MLHPPWRILPPKVGIKDSHEGNEDTKQGNFDSREEMFDFHP